MALVTFVAAEETEIIDCWPRKVVGHGFILLTLWEVCYTGDDIAIYRDQFDDEYIFEDSTADEWEIDVRED
jgi:hypothetical protein